MSLPLARVEARYTTMANPIKPEGWLEHPFLKQLRWLAFPTRYVAIFRAQT
jgi:hypothetical protein